MFMQPCEFFDNLRYFRINGTVIFRIDQYSPFESIKEGEYISDIGIWTTTPIGKPTQVSSALLRQGIRITRPVEIHGSRIVAPEIDTLARIDQGRIGPTAIPWQALTNINHPARNQQAANLHTFMTRYPLSDRDMHGRRGNAVARWISQ